MEVIILSNFLKVRIDLLRQLLRKQGLDGIIISNPENRYYLSGFTGEDGSFNDSAGILIITQEKLVLVTDGRFDVQASIEAPDYDVLCYKSKITKELPNIFKNIGIAIVGFESSYVSCKVHAEYLLAIDKNHYKYIMIPTDNLVESIRIIKSKYEINKIREALRLAENSFKKLITILKPGMTEKEAAWIFEKIIRKSGADSMSFPLIVASGPNSAMPHAKITNRKFEVGEPILFDWGVKLGSYCSDTSRTVVFGTPSNKFLDVYCTVFEAQKKAIDAVKAGVNTYEIDKVARNYINNTVYSGKFIHGLGHGTGLTVHEAPKVSQFGTEMLRVGMVITIEPGIYIPGWGGVRIENQLVVNEKSCEILNEEGPFEYQIKI